MTEKDSAHHVLVPEFVLLAPWVTDGHPFYIAANDDKWVQAGNLSVGDALLSIDGDDVLITGLESSESKEKVYNLTIANTHNYYVGRPLVLVHNSTCRLPHRTTPRIEQGDLKKGWEHIKARHIDGNHPTKGAGDLFPSGTTLDQVEQAAKEVVASGNQLSDPSKQVTYRSML
ncbi:polymorphic toxin-type HINT domain-containing protein [Gynuella sunshinyii]|uniref:polymorphic toxin-type HINT domain-containing protein n=1 Tax=Gynuella sunshinyii TaxID=1445505 RepID=UPI00069BBF2B|nr:polymorphic toxin-type HINT domain-containing protein [Gynuella sunshinyii]